MENAENLIKDIGKEAVKYAVTSSASGSVMRSAISETTSESKYHTFSRIKGIFAPAGMAIMATSPISPISIDSPLMLPDNLQDKYGFTENGANEFAKNYKEKLR